MKTVRCPQCNLVNWNSVLFCNRCGFDIQSIIEKEPAAESEMSFEPSGFQHSAQNSYSFNEQTAANFSDTQYSNDSYNQNFQTENAHHRQSYDGFRQQSYGNNRNSQNREFRHTGKTKKGMAITSLVLGILGMPWFGMIIGGIVGVILSFVLGTAGFVIGFSLPLLMPLIALITGIVSLTRANKKPSEFGGKGMAIAGICCSAFGLLIIPIVAAIAIPNLLAARRAANEGSAIASIRTLANAEITLRQTTGKPCAELTELGSAGLIDNVLAKGEKSGYRFIITELPSISRDCAITATPTSESNGNRAFYYSTEDGEIRAKTYHGQIADRFDPPIGQSKNDY